MKRNIRHDVSTPKRRNTNTYEPKLPSDSNAESLLLKALPSAIPIEEMRNTIKNFVNHENPDVSEILQDILVDIFDTKEFWNGFYISSRSDDRYEDYLCHTDFSSIWFPITVSKINMKNVVSIFIDKLSYFDYRIIEGDTSVVYVNLYSDCLKEIKSKFYNFVQHSDPNITEILKTILIGIIEDIPTEIYIDNTFEETYANEKQEDPNFYKDIKIKNPYVHYPFEQLIHIDGRKIDYVINTLKSLGLNAVFEDYIDPMIFINFEN